MSKLGFLFSTLLLVGLASCSRDENTPSASEGYIQVKVTASDEMQEEITRTADSEGPEVGEFALAIKNADGETVASWDKFSDYDPEKAAVPVGKYTVSASYGDASAEGFEALSYAGSTDVEVPEGESVSASVDCTINKARVSISYTDAFKEYFSSYSASITSASGKKIDYAANETRAAYFLSGNLDIYLSVTRPGATESVSLKVKTLTAELKHEYRLTMDVDAGSATLKIVFNDNPKNTQNVLCDISDAALNAAPPVFTANGFTAGEAIEVVEGKGVEGVLQAYINAPSGFSDCILTTKSAALKAQGWPEKIDLINATDAEKKKLTDMGLIMKGLGEKRGKIAAVEFQDVIPYLYCLADTNEVHTFTLTATNTFGKVSETPLELKVISLSNEFKMELPEYVPYSSETITGTLILDGDVSNVKFSYWDFGTWQDFEKVPKITQSSDEPNKYSVIFTFSKNLTNTERDYTIRAVWGTKEVVDNFKVEEQKLMISLKNGDSDVWAKHAILQVSVKTDNGWVASTDNVVIQYMDNDIWKDAVFTYKSEGFIVTGLSPDMDYTLRAVAKDDQTKLSDLITIHTETELSVPNGNMEDWYFTNPKNNNWEMWYVYKEGEQPIWDTMNALTTSTVGNYRYNSNSGTIRTDGKSGYAAQIRTVGWGNSNTAGGDWSYCQKVTLGELYIGYYDSNSQKAVYEGIEFTSRPKFLSFDYKYTPGKGGDQYYAEIVILNKQGETETKIGSGLLRNGASVQEWSSATVEIEYTDEGKKLKATHMYIVFKSGDRADTDSFNKKPSFGNLSDGEFVGSEFFVDNLNFIYE